MRFEPYLPAHDAQLKAFLESSETGEEGTPTVAGGSWRWRYRDPPDAPKPPYLALGFDGDQLAGARGAIPMRLVNDGKSLRGAQILEGTPTPSALDEESGVALGRSLLSRLGAEELTHVYGVVTSQRSADVLAKLGFDRPFDVVLRNLYLGLGSVSYRLDEAALNPFRKLAKFARRLRLKLIEVDFDESWLAYAARLFAQRRPELAFAIDRSQDYLRWRYKNHPEHRYRMLVLRRNAGMGIDAFVIVRMFEARPGRLYIQLIDHWTRIGERRWTAWLLGEVALWGMAEKADVIQAFAAAGSVLDQVLISLGCIRKKASLPFMVLNVGQNSAELPAPAPSAVQLRAGDLDMF